MRGLGETTGLLVAGSVAMFACCLGSAVHVLGARAALRFALIAVVLGWIAEELGAALRLVLRSLHVYRGARPAPRATCPSSIPLMWFALHLRRLRDGQPDRLADRRSTAQPPLGADGLRASLLAAMIVTAYDLGADPYMVFVLKAWIMTEDRTAAGSARPCRASPAGCSWRFVIIFSCSA